MILLDGGPSILRSRGEPIVFRSPEETVEYARIHDIKRWMVYGDREGWWPIYTQAGPVNPPPPPKERVDISLHWGAFFRLLARVHTSSRPARAHASSWR